MIHLGRLRDGSRKVLEISEVLGMSDGEIKLNPLYVFKEDAESSDKEQVKGSLVRTANNFVSDWKLKKAGLVWKDE